MRERATREETAEEMVVTTDADEAAANEDVLWAFETDVETDEYIMEDTYAYDSSQVSCVAYNEQWLLSIGLAQSPAGANGLYLNPEFYSLTSTKTQQYAFYFSSPKIPVQYSSDEPGEKNDTGTFFAVTDRTYDTLVPAEFRNTAEYGVKWSRLPEYGYEDEEFDIHIRVINLSDGSLAAVATLTICCDESGRYYFSDLVDSSLDAIGTEKIRYLEDAVFAYAVDFLVSGNDYQQFGLTAEDLYKYASRSIIEESTTYFGMSLNHQGKPENSKVGKARHVYAVNLYFPAYPLITVYVIPYSEKYGVADNNVTGDSDFYVAWYDPVFPESKQQMKDYLYPEFHSAFGL